MAGEYGLNQTYGTSGIGLSSPSGYAGFQSGGGGGDPYGLSGSMGQGGSGFSGLGQWAPLMSGLTGALGNIGSNPSYQISGPQISPQEQGLQQYMMNMLYGGMTASPQQTQNINKIMQGNIQQGTADINAERDIMNNQVFQDNLNRGMGASAPQQYSTGQVNAQALQSISDLINQQSNQAMQQQLTLPYMTGQYGNALMNQLTNASPRTSGMGGGNDPRGAGIGSLLGMGAGAFFGGPAGAAIGGQLGGSIGGLF